MTNEPFNQVVMQSGAPGELNGSGNSTEFGEQIEEQVGDGPSGASNETGNESAAETANGSGSGSTSGNETGNETGNGTDMPELGNVDGPGASGGDGGGGGMFGFDVESYVKDSAAVLRDSIADLGAWAFNTVIELIVGTGAPNRLVGAPTNEPWATFYSYAHGDVATISMILFAFVVACIGAAGTFAGILSTYKTRQLWWRAGAALAFDFLWWPIGTAGLQVIDWLAVRIAPPGEYFVSSIEGAVAAVAGAAIGGAVFHMISTGAIMILGLLYGARWVALAALLVFMRVLVMLWVVDASIFARISNLASGFMNMFVPLLVMPLPTAMLMRVSLLFFIAAASGNAGMLSGPALVFVALGTLVASVFAPKYTFDYAKAFMSQSFGAEKIGKQLDAKLSQLGAGLGSGSDGSSSGTTTATLETPPALPTADPTATPSTGGGGSAAPAAPATEPVTATGGTTATATAATATESDTSTQRTRAADRASMSDATPTQPTTWEALNEDPDNGGTNVNKYTQDTDFSTDEQRVESRRRQLRRESAIYGGDD